MGPDAGLGLPPLAASLVALLAGAVVMWMCSGRAARARGLRAQPVAADSAHAPSEARWCLRTRSISSCRGSSINGGNSSTSSSSSSICSGSAGAAAAPLPIAPKAAGSCHDAPRPSPCTTSAAAPCQLLYAATTQTIVFATKIRIAAPGPGSGGGAACSLCADVPPDAAAATGPDPRACYAQAALRVQAAAQAAVDEVRRVYRRRQAGARQGCCPGRGARRCNCHGGWPRPTHMHGPPPTHTHPCPRAPHTPCACRSPAASASRCCVRAAPASRAVCKPSWR